MFISALLATKNRATILTASPKFTSGLQCPTTLLELVEEIYERKKRSEPGYKIPDVNFHRDIAPLFNRIYEMSWTNRHANAGHGTYLCQCCSTQNSLAHRSQKIRVVDK